MKYIFLIAILTVIFLTVLYNCLKMNLTRQQCIASREMLDEENNWFKPYLRSSMLLILLAGALLRIFCAYYFKGHADMSCFEYWGQLVYNNGFKSFYESTSLSDYMPGYIYVLRVLEAIRNLFGIAYDGPAALLLYKLPAMIFDMLISILIYKIARKNFDYVNSILIMCMFVFNPVVILNSSMWGQIDSILTFFLLLMCYLIYQNKLKFSYIVFGIGCLIKPQMLVFTPVLLLAFIENIFIVKNENGVKFKLKTDELFMQGTYAVMSIAATLLLCMPFGIGNVISQCFDTLGSYEYASVNAYNFWAMLGLDWASQDDYLFFLTYKQWGILFILALVFFSIMIWINNYNERSRYIAMAALLGIGMFTLSVRMHERYIFPAIIVMILLFVLTKKAGAFWLYAILSAISFCNSAHVLFYYDPYNFDGRAAMIVICGLASTITFVFLCIYITNNYLKHAFKFQKFSELFIKSPKQRVKTFTIEKSAGKVSFTKIDFIMMFVITILYAAVAFYNLGDKDVPDSTCYIDGDDEWIFKFNDEVSVSDIEYYLGNYENREFNVYTSDDGKYWSLIGDMEMVSVFAWDSFEINTNCRYIKLNPISEKAVVNEIIIRDSDGNIILPVNYEDDDVSGLFDEQQLAVDEFTYRNSTIFDEIYHARSAYEFNNNLYCYEWTHPPLGKVFISWGMKAFGTNPFGWRFMGTLFGVLMLPFMYMFGKKVFKSSFFAMVTGIFMACDFMHFAQTRIATIDVFVTFFVILMYFFMYQYYEMSFYDTSLKKTLIPLGLCGISMGLGCASKWTGVYAGAGLGVIFFFIMYKRLKEYLYARKDPMGITNGIKHSTIIRRFPKCIKVTIAFCVVFFIIVPGIIYTLSYIPFVGCNESPTSLIGRMIYNQSQMFNYHKDCIFDHPYSSRWYEWALMIKPILYYSGVNGDGNLERISSFGNPFIWWFGIGAFIYLLIRIKKNKDKTATFFVIGYLAQMLPWTLVVRTTFIYHYFTSVPFIIMMDVYCLYLLVVKNKKNVKFVILYTIIVVGAFALFYPALSGAPMSEFFDHNILRWLDSWYV